MKRFCLLVISLCALKPIYVNCDTYPVSIVEKMTFIELTADDQAKGREIASGDVVLKCAQAKDDAIEERVKIKSVITLSKLWKLYKFWVNESQTVIGVLCHDNPMIVLGSDKEVYVL